MVVPQANQVTVSFPAKRAFSRLGRVSVGGLATRLSLDISVVEELRLAADSAVRILVGDGRITVTSQWGEQDLVVRLENPLAQIPDEAELEPDSIDPADAQVERIVEPPNRVFLRVRRQLDLQLSDEDGDEDQDEEE